MFVATREVHDTPEEAAFRAEVRGWLDRVEWACQWLLSRVVWHSERYPFLSGAVTGLGISAVAITVVALVVGLFRLFGR